MSNKKLTKDDEAKLPKFTNREEAINYFAEKYGEDFVFSNSFIHEGENIHVYLFILNREKFNDMQIYIKQRGNSLIPVSDPQTKGYTDSCKSIHIHENGKVVVVI